MFRLYYSFFKQWLFWLLFFALGRSTFLLYYGMDAWEQSHSIGEILLSYVYGFNLDLATASYFMFIPFGIHLLQTIYSPTWLNQLNKYFQWILIVLYALLISSELGIYEEWKTKINYKALLYMQNPQEVIDTAQTGQTIILVSLSIILSTLGIWFYNKYIHTNIIRLQQSFWVGLIFALITPILLVLSARGGINEIPINQSQSYYSKHSILNSAATNSVFNLYISFHENRRSMYTNPFEEMPTAKAQEIVKQIYKTPSDSCLFILNTKEPNIILIIMESWSSELIFTPKDKQVVTPNFRKLMSEGVYFDNIYASGPRSEQGMASIFSGFPAHPISSITVQPDKYNKLPSIIKDFNKKGYHTSFSFGGQLIYGNIKSYIMYNQFDRIKEVNDFSDTLPQGKLGIHDEFTLQEMIAEVNKDPQPFFSALFTISTHSPYDQPMEKKIDWGGDVKQYLNGGNYTDYSIGKFMEEAKKQDWYNNTLFIFVADHSHNSYSKLPMQNMEYQKIPLLFYGEVIDSAFKGKTIPHLGIQTDIAASLLCQLDMDTKKYHWSKNLLNTKAPQFAYSAYEEGFMWKRPAGTVSYEKRFDHLHQTLEPESLQDSLLTEGKAFLQVLFQEYLDQ
ncbi:MAG: hypothetical protein B7C24_06550 [Bacteroidetes bacterium 4572_77]|nr:MAG: hypothetical protein B7C24_06550 [Bacteroidetes bacterium 4572_77]